MVINLNRPLLIRTLAMIAGTYIALMLIFSWSSNDRVLLRAQEKHFSELDFQVAYAVLDVKQAKSPGNPSQLSALKKTIFQI